MNTMFCMADKKDLRVRLRGALKAELDGQIARFNVSQVDAVNSMVEWVLRQPDGMKAIVFGSVPETLFPMAARDALREIADADKKQKKAAG